MNISVKDWGNCVKDGVATLECLPILFTNVINILLGGAGVVALFFVALAGYRMITSRGDPAKLDSARKTFFYALIGLTFIFFSFFILSLVGKFTGVKQIPN